MREVLAKTLHFMLVAGPLFTSQGCTTLALRRHALDQTESAMDIRYHEVLDNLSMIADNPAALPAYSTIYAGTTNINDSIAVKSGTTWARTAKKPAGFTTGFSSDVLDLPSSRAVTQNWTLDPVIVPEKLRALRCACWWALWGPPSDCKDCQLLKTYVENNPDEYPAGYYFGVADTLAAIEPGWLHIVTNGSEPRACRFHSTCHCTTVWVCNRDIDRLSAFTLVVQAIARTNVDSAYFPRPATKSVVLKADSNKTLNSFLSLGNAPENVSQITVHVDQDGRPTPGADMPALTRKSRFDDVGTFSDLKSIINAAAASKSP